MKNKLFSLLFFLPLSILSTQAQRYDKEKATIVPSDEKSWLIGIGSANILDSYISPENYHGTDIRFISQSRHHQKKRPQWITEMTHMGSFQTAKPRSEDSNNLAGAYTFCISLKRQWKLSEQLYMEAGGEAGFSLGFLYNNRNGNNPAQLKSNMNISPSAGTSYFFPLCRKTIKINYEVSAPLLGLMFSPNYGQSYYEIFSRGNYDRNLVPVTPFNSPSLRHMLSVDVPLKWTILRVGYLGDYQQAEVNHLKYHTYSHLLIIGFTIHR